MNDRALRQHLQRALDWSDAHATFDDAVRDVPESARGVRPPGVAHSLWQLVDHIRRTQADILDFCRNPAYREPDYEEYWPPSPAPNDAATWDASLAAVRRDREAMKALAGDASVDLFARIPHGSGQTYLREIVLVIDHTAYHVGQLILARRVLGVWPS
jgi:hypothetical protein